MKLKIKDEVTIIDDKGKPVAEGTIVNINDFREPNLKYAIDVKGYVEDVLFFGGSQLVKKSNPPYSEEEYQEAKQRGLDLDDWSDYVKYFGVGEEDNNYFY